MAKSTNEKDTSKTKTTSINTMVKISVESFYQLMIASYKDMVGARICINHLNKNGIKAILSKWNGSYMILSQKYGFKQSVLREKARIEELRYKPTFI
ncbi:hypothetical protein [Clostridium chrysemydis]|uniref:hypothetical protein n=1 Tax=Clostridium chrysemydis TaxID=2665504 RepID=UPI001884347F|nr:hypothetical protein [Clostridium chrysemydis]